MKAKQKTLLVLLVLVAALAAGLLALSRANEQAEQAASAAEEGTIPLSAFAIEDLTQIAYTYNGETLTLDYSGGVWILAEDPAYHISQSQCNTMAAALCALNAKRSLEAGSGEDYGVDTPLVTVSVTAAGQTNTFRFGDINAITGDLYLQKEGDGAVYTVAASKAACFEAGKADLFEAFNPAGLTRSAVQEVRYEFSGAEEQFTVHLKAVSEAADDETYETVWRLAADPSAELDSSAVDALLAALGASVTGQVTNPESLAAYGLDAPLVTVRAVTEEGEATLFYSVGADGCYMQVEGDPSVYCVDSSTIEAFCLTEEELAAPAA